MAFQRSPLNKDNCLAYKNIKDLINAEKYDLIHSHTPVASACIRLACRKIENVKVFYTAHGFHFFKGASLINWLIYYPIERWLSLYTDVLITINKEDYDRAKKLLKADRVEYVPGVGLNIKKFSKVIVDKSLKRREIEVPNDAFVVISVGELNRNKNHEIIIKASLILYNMDNLLVYMSQSIPKCINSIVRQTFENWELICCDDCSNDNSLSILQRWEKLDRRIKVLHNKKNSKVSFTRNKCIEESKGKYIALIDDDDFCVHDRLEIRYYNFKRMKLLPKYFPYVIKPLIVGLVPVHLLERIKKNIFKV